MIPTRPHAGLHDLTSPPSMFFLRSAIDHWLPFLVVGVCCFSLSCPIRAADTLSPEDLEFFESQVRPLLIEHCYSCHSNEADSREGGLLLDHRAGWETGGEHGASIIPGNVADSLLVRAIRYADDDLQMPPEKKLSDEQIAILEGWIARGAPDPRDTPSPKPTGPKPSDPIAGREHWAYRPLNVVPPPAVQRSDWPGSAIDHFILNRLEQEGLSPSPDADRRTLGKRLHFQLIGLPPTPEQMANYLSDTSPEATEHLVDSLLESPHFGERWGRHWLDLARYADSNGLDENFLFREAWRYRNWVINAVNEDLPYDRFLTEQIAGDLLPFDSIEQRDRQRIASGFLLLGPKVLLGNNPENQKMEVADEQLTTIGKTVLAQTLGCARCHDHKFDPIPTRDYYALAGILTSTQVMEQRYMLGQQRVMEQLIGLGPEGDKLDGDYETYWRTRTQLKEHLDRAKQALEHLKNDETDKLRELAEKHADAVAEGACEPKDSEETSKESRIALQQTLVTDLETKFNSPPPIPPRAMVPEEKETPADEKIRIAGQFDKPGDAVPRGFLQVLTNEPCSIPDDQSGRLELAHWLTDTEHGAGQLAARVLANRIWHHLMGRGLVRTVDNFGRTGEEPSHPDLLDYLAKRLIDADWSVKTLIREIALSRTFAMSSTHNERGHEQDPDNRLLWRAHRRRLDPESMRDAMLLAAGKLDLTPMESSVWYLGDQATAVGANENRRRTDFPNRSVYLPVIRNDLPELFDVFDFADPHATTGLRSETIVATQALYLLNDESVMQSASETANRLLTATPDGDAATRVKLMYEWILAEPPTPEELSEMSAFVDAMAVQLKDAEDAQRQAWQLACQTLFASTRFQILE
ncbi:MAG: DUF1549 domain-containing protein [Planctomycetaceae bacterium]|nr:DUF1549 domain-containing protein [Planctomycetaceae bacterium]